MADLKAQTKVEALMLIMNSLVDKYLIAGQKTIINPDDFFIKKAEREIFNSENAIRSFGSDGYIAYYSTLGILYAVKGEYGKSKEYYQKAINLNPKELAHTFNYINVLRANGNFDDVKLNVIDHLEFNKIDYSSLLNLYNCGLRDLDFNLFQQYYEKVRSQDVLSIENKKFMEKLYRLSHQIKPLEDDLNKIGVDKVFYSEFYDFLTCFHSKRVYGNMDVRFTVENTDEQNLIVDVYVDALLDEAVALTSEFESKLVNYTYLTGHKSMLSKFLVYYKPEEMKDSEDVINDIYLGIQEDEMV